MIVITRFKWINIYIIWMVDRVTRASDGRLSLDMLIGLSIFLVTFIFIAQFLPTVFADVRSEIGLAHEAYKVTVMLAEVEGAWSNGTHNGTNWEDYPDKWGDPDFIFLPSLSMGEPDYLDYKKIRAFDNVTKNYYDKVREMLGLKTPDRNYNFHVSIESLDSRPYNRTLVTDKSGNVLLDAGTKIPSSGYISRYERNVWIHSIYDLVGTYDIGSAGSANFFACKKTFTGSENNIVCNLTHPVKFFEIYVKGKNGSANPWWLSICLYPSPPGPSACSKSNDHLTVNWGDSDERWNETLTPNTKYDLTEVLRKIASSEGLDYGDELYLKFRVKNMDAWLNASSTVDYLAGKAVAKLVVYVW